MTFLINQRKTCRVCGSDDLHCFLKLPKMPLADGHVQPNQTEEPFLADLDIFWCPSCGVVQTLHDVDLSDYYKDYDYTVSCSAFVQEFMQTFARDVWKMIDGQPGDAVVEVGSGDGLQLKYFKELGARVLGFEPSRSLARAAQGQGIETIAALFSRNTIAQIPQDITKVKLVVCQYTFDHVPEPLDFLKDTAQILDPQDGVVVIEVHDFEKIVERNEACLFTHEHAGYFTEASLGAVLERAGFKMIASGFIPEEKCRGNSLIVAAALNSSSRPAIRPQASELLTELRRQEAYDIFSQTITRSHARLRNRVRQMRLEGRRVAGYGAAGRGINTLMIAGLTENDIECVFDMNPKLQGLYLPGVNIPVRAPEELFSDPIEEVIVFSYGYFKEIETFLDPYIRGGGRVTSVLEYLLDE